MQIVDFTSDHTKVAVEIAWQNYEQERGYAHSLPPVDRVPDLKSYADNGLGVAAFEEDIMVGFLCSVPPFKNAFGSTNADGVFSPMGANGVVGENRAKIYARLYQAAAEKWVRAGASSHAVCLYAHDREAQEQFFRYGFGLRCVDAIRKMDVIDISHCMDYEFVELPQREYISVYQLDQFLNQHQRVSPFFMNRKPDSLQSFIKSYEKCNSRFFVAKHCGKICAYLKILRDGETFIADDKDYIHIGGAFCLPEHRGKGVYSNLLNYVIHILKKENYSRLGVDFESLNPTAWGFWLKHFAPYTHSLVRRIDENVLTNEQVQCMYS